MFVKNCSDERMTLWMQESLSKCERVDAENSCERASVCVDVRAFVWMWEQLCRCESIYVNAEYLCRCKSDCENVKT